MGRPTASGRPTSARAARLPRCSAVNSGAVTVTARFVPMGSTVVRATAGSALAGAVTVLVGAAGSASSVHPASSSTAATSPATAPRRVAVRSPTARHDRERRPGLRPSEGSWGMPPGKARLVAPQPSGRQREAVRVRLGYGVHSLAILACRRWEAVRPAGHTGRCQSAPRDAHPPQSRASGRASARRRRHPGRLELGRGLGRGASCAPGFPRRLLGLPRCAIPPPASYLVPCRSLTDATDTR